MININLWYEKIQKLKEKPELYIGKKSLIFLKLFTDGYMEREYELNESRVKYVDGFQEFIQKRYKINSSHHWANIITFFSSTDEEAFDTFYELLDEFMKIKVSK